MIEFLIGRRGAIALALLVLTMAFVLYVPDIEVESSLKDYYAADEASRFWQRKYDEAFGNDEFVLIAMRCKDPVVSPTVLKSIAAVTAKLAEMTETAEVRSLTNLREFSEIDGLFRVRRVIKSDGPDDFTAPNIESLIKMRKELPYTRLLISADLKTAGIVVKIRKEARFGDSMRRLLADIRSTVAQNTPPGSDIRMVGVPVTRQAFLRYNIESAVSFTLIGFLSGTLVVLYLFRSLRVTAIVILISPISIVWMLGCMSFLGIRINTGTCMSFGIILVVGIAIIIHIVTHFDRAYMHNGDREQAIRESLRIVGAPCLMCALTTAAGFASIMVSSVPIVKQVGLIMSLGVLTAFILTITLTPTLLFFMKPVSAEKYRRIGNDALSRLLERLWGVTLRHRKKCALGLILVVLLSASGIPIIRTKSDPFLLFNERTPEFRDVAYVQHNLVSVKTIDLLIEAADNAWKKEEPWKRVRDFEEKVARIPNVVGTDSLLHFLRRLHGAITQSEADPKGPLDKPGVVRELLMLTSSSGDGRRLIHNYVDDTYRCAKVTVHLEHFGDSTVREIIGKIGRIADSTLQGAARCAPVGALANYTSQVSELVRSQVLSLLLALTVISVLMTIQFRSIMLGLLSLIPNFIPMVVILGVMGLLDIGLDNITVFAAAVTLGLSVDDTIHYLVQIKREIQSPENAGDVEKCVTRAYQVTSRALTSTSAVLIFAFVTLLMSPFRPLNDIGVMLSLGIFTALIGDLVLLPSLIVSSPTLKYLVRNA